MNSTSRRGTWWRDQNIRIGWSDDDAGLDQQIRSDPREMAGNGWGSQKNRLLDLRLQALEEKIAINTQEAKDQMTTRMDSLMKSMEDRIDDRLDKILTIVEQNQRINDTTRKGKQSETDPLRGNLQEIQ